MTTTIDAIPPLAAPPCSVCADVLQRLGGHDCSRLDGEHGLAAATMRSHEALLRVCDLLEGWKRIMQNRNNITWDAMDAGDTLRLRKSIDELEAAISPPNSKLADT
jgi:hypothetical protein